MRINRVIAASLTGRSRLRWTVARMISTNSLAAFTQEVARTRPPVPQVEPVQARPSSREATPSQRTLEAVPPMPAKPLPRGSLLDLRA
jgi:hypothetical protein